MPPAKSSSGTPSRLAPLTRDQKASHERLLRRIYEGDAKEARTDRSLAMAAACGKRAMRGGNSAMGLLGGAAVGSDVNTSALSNSGVRRASGNVSFTDGDFTPQSTALAGRRAASATPYSTPVGGRGNSPPALRAVGEVGKLLVSANIGPMTSMVSLHQRAGTPTGRSPNKQQQQYGNSPRNTGSMVVPPTTAIATISTGIAIAVQQSSFEELSAHGVWDLDGTNSCHLPLPTIEAIFKAKLRDSYTVKHGIGGGGRVTLETPSSLADNACANDRLMRFVEVVAKKCRGIYFDVAGLGLGKTALEVVVDALISDHQRELGLISRAEEESNAGGGVNGVGSNNNNVGKGKGGGNAIVAGNNNAANKVDPNSAYSIHFDYPAYAVVDFSRNIAGDEAGDAIARLLRENESIVALNLLSMGLVNNPSTCSIFYTIAYQNNTLTCLDLSGITGTQRNNLGGEAGMALGEMLRHNQIITTLRLRDCGLEPTSLAHLFSSAMVHDALVDLDVSGNRIDKHSVAISLASMLAYGACALERLVMDGCGIGDSSLETIAKGLNQHLHSMSADESTQNEAVSLQKYHPYNRTSTAAGGSRIGGRVMTAGSGAQQQQGRGGAIIGLAEKSSSSVGSLSAIRAGTPISPTSTKGGRGGKRVTSSSGRNNSTCGGDGVFTIPPAPASTCLKTLILSNNNFGSAGLVTLADKIQKLPKLEVLDISHNHVMKQPDDIEGMPMCVSMVGIDSLIRSLADTVPTLVELNLTNCHMKQMSSQTELLLCKCLSLQTLKVSRNPFGDFGARIIGEGLFQRAYALKNKYVMAARNTTGNGGDGNTTGSGYSSKVTSRLTSAHATRPGTASASMGTMLSHSAYTAAVEDAGLDDDFLHQDPFALLAMCDCKITQQGMLSFLRHVAQAPKVQITGTGLIVGFRSATINPYDGSGAVIGSDESAAPPAPPVGTPPTTASLFTPEVIVPSGYHGLAILSLKLTQPSWSKWDTDLVDALCHTPCLEHTDLGKYATDSLLKGLEAHRAARIANSLPKYQRQVELVKREENRLFEAKDHIQDEMRRTEKAKEQFKSVRDRQKAMLNALKTEYATATDNLAKKNEALDEIDSRVSAAQSYNREKEEQMAAELQRLVRKTEATQNMRKDLEQQMKTRELKQRKYNELMASVRKEVESSRDLRLVRGAVSVTPNEVEGQPDVVKVVSHATIMNAPQHDKAPPAAAGGGGGASSRTSITGTSATVGTSVIQKLQRQQSNAALNNNGPSLLDGEEGDEASDAVPPPPVAVGTGLQAIDIYLMAAEMDLQHTLDECENEKGMYQFVQKQLDDLNRRIALTTELANAKKGKGGKGKGGGDKNKKKGEADAAKDKPVAIPPATA